MKQFIEDYLEFERKNNLFDLQIDGVYFWQLVRKRVSDNIMIKLNILSQPSQTVAQSKIERIKTFLIYLSHAFVNLFKKIPKVDAIIINHPRKILFNDDYVDIYTYYLQEEYKSKKVSFLTLDVPVNWHKHLIKKEPYIRNMENFSIIKKVFYKYFYKKKNRNNNILQEISNKLDDEFGYDGNVVDVINTQIHIFKQDYNYYTKFFKKAKPKEVSIVISDVYPGIVKAAKDLNITTIEVQHGAITKEHLGYEYPYNKIVEYFPDKIRLFGEYWYDTVDMPIKKENIILTENKFLTVKSAEKVSKNKKQVLFVTQGWVTLKMIKVIKEFCKLTKEYEVVVKLHPSEFEYWKKEYPQLLELQKKYSIKVIDNFEKGIYDLLQESQYVVGVSSTCLYEALYFDCNVCLLDLPSVEMMADLVDKKIASLSNNAEELLKNIKKRNKGKIDLNYIYYRGGKNENRK